MRTAWDFIRYALLGAALVALMAFVLFAFATRDAHADELRLGVGQLLNNRGADPWLFEATAQKDHALGHWDARLSYTYAQHGSLGGPDGGEQNLSLYATLPVWEHRDWRLRVGPGLILAHHWPASRTAIKDGLSVKQCLACGVTFELGLDWRRWSVEARYWHTDPNAYPAHNGMIAVVEYGL